MINRIPSNYLLFMLLILFCVSTEAESVVDKCITKADEMSLVTADHGIRVADKRAAMKLADICRKALKDTAGSEIIKLSLAKSLVWSGEYSDAYIRLDELLGSKIHDEVISLASALCAYGKGSTRVQTSTCTWALEEGIPDPELAYLASQQVIAKGNSEMGLRFLAQSAAAGHKKATPLVTRICNSFDATKPKRTVAGNPGLSSMDPFIAAAITCEVGYLRGSDSFSDWAKHSIKYVEVMTHFDGYDVIGEVLYELGKSKDATVYGDAINISERLCTALAGDPDDPKYGSDGVPTVRIIPGNAIPVCETAAILWPENGRLHYNLARTYAQMGNTHEADADAALAEAIRLGYPLAKSLSAPTAVAFDISEFNAPVIIRAFYEQDFSQVNQEPYYTLVYTQALNAVLSSGDVLFLGENARFLSLEVDAGLSHKALKRIQDPALFQDTMNKGIASIWAPFKGIIETRQRGGTVEEEVQSMFRHISESPQVQAELLKKQAEQDAKRLAILFDTNSEDVKKIIAGMTAFMEQ